jgi:hypothetical protein
MNWFAAKCPVDDSTRTWTENNLGWLLQTFEFPSAQDVTVVLPTPEFFPDPYAGTEADVRRLFQRVCDLMEVDADRLKLELVADTEGALRHQLPSWESGGKGVAGHYQGDAQTATIRLNMAYRRDPMAMVAVMAHELSHVLLLGDEKISRERWDHEMITDLATVALGMGIFNANSAFKFAQWSGGGMQGWSAGRLGYLTEQNWGYALAYFAKLRGESKPAWAQHLKGDVKHYFKAGMKYLRKQDNLPPADGDDVR